MPRLAWSSANCATVNRKTIRSPGRDRPPTQSQIRSTPKEVTSRMLNWSQEANVFTSRGCHSPRRVLCMPAPSGRTFRVKLSSILPLSASDCVRTVVPPSQLANRRSPLAKLVALVRESFTSPGDDESARWAQRPVRKRQARKQLVRAHVSRGWEYFGLQRPSR